MTSHDGVLLVAHGSVANSDEIPEFLRQIRRGRPASEQLIVQLDLARQGGRWAAVDRASIEVGVFVEVPVGDDVLFFAKLPGIQKDF